MPNRRTFLKAAAATAALQGAASPQSPPIPQSVITTPSQNLLKYIPLPNSGQYFSTSANNQTLNGGKGSARIDSNSRFGMISGYYFIDDFTLINPYGGASLPGFASGTTGRAQMFNFSDTKTFGPSMVNEFRIHFMRTASISGEPIGGGLGVTLSSQGFVTGPNTLGIDVVNKALEGVETISFNNYSLGVSVSAAGQYNNTYQLMDWIRMQLTSVRRELVLPGFSLCKSAPICTEAGGGA